MSPDHSRLEAVYDTDATGKVNLSTILFPQGSTTQKPQFMRISEAEYNGSSVTRNNMINDVILQSSVDSEVVYGDISFHGKSLVSRNSQTGNLFYFVRQGVKFNMPGTGFESDLPVSIHVKGKEGVIISQGATIRLNGTGMNSVSFVPSVTEISSGADFIEVQLPAGEIRFSGS